MRERPDSVLFSCTHNSVRSAMAEGLLKYLQGRRLFVDSAGVREGQINGFVIAVMDELGIDMSKHRAKTFDELADHSFDLIITLSPEAQHRAVELTRTMACDVEYWPTVDPTVVEGPREVQLAAYREVRDSLLQRLRQRFPLDLKPVP